MPEHDEVGTYGHLAVGCKVKPQGAKQEMVVAALAVDRKDPEKVTAYLIPGNKKIGDAKAEPYKKSIEKLERID